jgi:hypothetical protein
MSDQDLFPDEEGSEQEKPSEELPDELPDEVPEADAAEQTRPLTDAGSTRTDRVGDRPEADALEQDRVEGPEDDDDRR